MEHNTSNDYSNVNKAKFIHSNTRKLLLKCDVDYSGAELFGSKNLAIKITSLMSLHTIARIIITP